jgi:hypothetical protein
MSYIKLPEDFKRKWIEALRSGEYKQGKYTLFDKDNNSFCCIGVACTIYNNNTIIHRNGFLPNGDYGYAALPAAIAGGSCNTKVARLISMNDEEGKSFSQIAGWIEENL